MNTIATSDMTVATESSPGRHVPRILSIIGVGRSGSTLIEGYIQKNTDAIGVGELAYIWDRGWRDNELCGCGRAFRQCEFWQSSIADAFGCLTDADARRFAAAFRSARGTLTQSSASFRRAIIPDPLFAQVANALYGSLAKNAGDRMLIDSSKMAYFSANLVAAGVGDLSLLHTIRDPRGVVYSLLNPKPRPQARGGRTTMGKSTSIFHAVARWGYRNAQASALRHAAHVPSSIISYEEFCRDPERIFSQIIRIHDLQPRSDGRQAQWHSVSGNPIRFDEQILQIQLDERWRERMPLRQQIIVNCLCSLRQRAMEAEIQAQARRV